MQNSLCIRYKCANTVQRLHFHLTLEKHSLEMNELDISRKMPLMLLCSDYVEINQCFICNISHNYKTNISKIYVPVHCVLFSTWIVTPSSTKTSRKTALDPISVWYGSLGKSKKYMSSNITVKKQCLISLQDRSSFHFITGQGSISSDNESYLIRNVSNESYNTRNFKPEGCDLTKQNSK